MSGHRWAWLAGGLVAGALMLGSAGAVVAGRSLDSGEQAHNTALGNQGFGGATATPCPGGMMNNGGTWNNWYPGGMMGGWSSGTAQGNTLSLDQAQQSVQRYIAQFGNRNLAIDEVVEFQCNFYAIVKDRSTGHGAYEVLVDKVTGAVFPEYGPAMMWNTTYGMMGPMMGYQQPSGPMAIAPAQVMLIARQWLAQHQPGSTTEAPEQFPGYYTVHIRRHGTITGMLSVNGYSGQVWYHTWHGAFIRMKDLHA